MKMPIYIYASVKHTRKRKNRPPPHPCLVGSSGRSLKKIVKCFALLQSNLLQHACTVLLLIECNNKAATQISLQKCGRFLVFFPFSFHYQCLNTFLFFFLLFFFLCVFLAFWNKVWGRDFRYIFH